MGGCGCDAHTCSCGAKIQAACVLSVLLDTARSANIHPPVICPVCNASSADSWESNPCKLNLIDTAC